MERLPQPSLAARRRAIRAKAPLRCRADGANRPDIVARETPKRRARVAQLPLHGRQRAASPAQNRQNACDALHFLHFTAAAARESPSMPLTINRA
jgi:hypothetical protein